MGERGYYNSKVPKLNNDVASHGVNRCFRCANSALFLIPYIPQNWCLRFDYGSMGMNTGKNRVPLLDVKRTNGQQRDDIVPPAELRVGFDVIKHVSIVDLVVTRQFFFSPLFRDSLEKILVKTMRGE